MFFGRKYPTDSEVRKRLSTAKNYWRDSFKKSDIYIFGSRTKHGKKKPILLSSIGMPNDSMIIRDFMGKNYSFEDKKIGESEIKNPFQINGKLYKSWTDTREKYKSNMKFKKDQNFGDKELIYTPEEMRNSGFVADCSSFTAEDLSKAQRVLKMFADYLGVPEDDTLWAARYVIGETFTGEGHASMNLADLEYVMKKDNREKCTWRNPNSTTFFYGAQENGWNSFSGFPKVGSRFFRMNHKNIWGSADHKNCYMRTDEIGNVGGNFYKRYNTIFHFTQEDRTKWNQKVIDGMIALHGGSLKMNVEGMKTILRLSELHTGSDRVNEIADKLRDIDLGGGLKMIETVRSHSGIERTLNLLEIA